MEALLRQHDGLVPWVIRRDCRSDVAYAELVHEGQIALWQAIMHYDAGCGIAFSTYAVPAIRHRLWRLVRETQRPQGHGVAAAADDPLELAAQVWQRQAVRAALKELLAHLPERSYHVIVSAYGLDGEAPLSMAEIGRLLGLSRERVRQIRNDALALLRLPALSGRLRRLCDQGSQADYRRSEALNRAWLDRRRAGRLR
ncbi:MAG: sigma-70 family RNA polymerase sigma factor [Anaerolineae bacterium]